MGSELLRRYTYYYFADTWNSGLLWGLAEFISLGVMDYLPSSFSRMLVLFDSTFGALRMDRRSNLAILFFLELLSTGDGGPLR